MHSKRLILSAAAAALLGTAPLQAGFFDDLGKQLGDAVTNTQSSSTASTAASGVSSLSDAEVDGGLREALKVGTKLAIDQLGKENGYFGNAAVKIPVPEQLQLIATGLQKVGMGSYVDDFVLSLNRAAEKAVPETAAIFGKAITGMSLDDARKILSGPDDAATEYFREKATPELKAAFLPIVQKYTQEAQVTTYYKAMVAAYDSYAAPMVEKSGLGGLAGMVTGGSSEQKSDYSARDLDGYITGKGLDGLFTMVADEEKKIRENPAARTTDLLSKVFGAL